MALGFIDKVAKMSHTELSAATDLANAHIKKKELLGLLHWHSQTLVWLASFGLVCLEACMQGVSQHSNHTCVEICIM